MGKFCHNKEFSKFSSEDTIPYVFILYLPSECSLLLRHEGLFSEKLIMKSHFNFGFAILICLVIGCKKNNEEVKPFLASFQATINKVQISYEQSADYRLAGGGSFINNINGTDSAGIGILSGLYKVQFEPDTIIQNSIYVFFIEHIPEDSLNGAPFIVPLPDRVFRRIFTLGDHVYTFLPSIKGGIIVTWYDMKGKKWATGRDNSWDTIPGARPYYSNNSFSVTFSNPITVQTGTYIYKQEVHMIFNCWVYNKEGDSLHIENAKFNTIYTY